MPKQIPMSEKREWLADFDNGKPAAVIAKEKKRALKVVKRGVDEARAERDGATAHAEIIKQALINHQKQLKGIVERLMQAAEVPPLELELRREKNGNIAPIPINSGKILHTPAQGLIIELTDENTTLWKLLKEHLQRDRLWSTIKKWKETLSNNIKARLALKSQIKLLIEMETKLKVADKEPTDIKTPFIYPHTVNLFYLVNMRKALGIPDGTNTQERITASGDDYVRHGDGGSELAYCPGKQNECQEALKRAFEKVVDTQEIKMIATTNSELTSMNNKLKQRLEDIQLMGLITGRCRICSRISL
jgi:hypothetical protein